VNVENPLKKIQEFQAHLKASDKPQLAMTPVEEGQLSGLLTLIKNTDNYHLTKITDVHFELLQKKLLLWPTEYLFPVIDVVRMMIMHPSTQALFGTYETGTHSKSVLGASFFTNIIRCVKPTSPDSLLITTLRCMCNLYDGASTSSAITRMLKLLLGQFPFIIEHKNKNVLSAGISLLLKYNTQSRVLCL
jgi:phospholipase A-2-activating protein